MIYLAPDLGLTFDMVITQKINDFFSLCLNLFFSNRILDRLVICKNLRLAGQMSQTKSIRALCLGGVKLNTCFA